jgi:hypothetical protein
MARALALLALVSLAAFVSASSPEGEAYLKANALKEGVVTLPSGLQYKARELAGLRTRALAKAPGARGRARGTHRDRPGSNLRVQRVASNAAAREALRAHRAAVSSVQCLACGTRGTRPAQPTRAQLQLLPLAQLCVAVAL